MKKGDSNIFIKDKIDLLVSEFPRIKCSLGLSSHDPTYILKIEPEIYFQEAKTFLFRNLNFLKEFSKTYIYEGVCFITDSSFIDIENTSYIKEGVEYINNSIQ